MNTLSFTKIYVYLAITFGIVFIYLNPPFQSPDEPVHFWKAYTVEQRNFFPDTQNGKTGLLIPVDLINDVGETGTNGVTLDDKFTFSEIEKWNNEQIVEEYVELKKIGTQGSNPILYLFPSIGIFVSKVVGYFTKGTVGLSATYMLYFARLFCLIGYVILSAIAIKTTPIFKKSMSAVALMPMSLYLGSSVSSDALLIPVAMLTLSLIFKLTFDEAVKEVKWRHIIYLTVLGFILFEMKTVYFTIMLLTIFVSKEKFGDKVKFPIEKMKKALIIVGAIGLLVIISRIPMWIAPHANTVQQTAVSDQINFLLKNPVKFISILLNTLQQNGYLYLCTTIGVFGWLTTYLPPFAYFLFAFFIIVLFISEVNTTQVEFSWQYRLVSIAAILVTALIVFGVMYVSWTSTIFEKGVGADVIEGVQGRYFIPILLLIVPMLQISYLKKSKLAQQLFKFVLGNALLPPFVILIVASLTLLVRFWA